MASSRLKYPPSSLRLPLDPGKFRLLKLLLAAKKGQPVQCTVNQFSLEEAPSYEALSYTWEQYDPTSATVVVTNGHPLTVSQNLNHALQRLRDRPNGGLLWVDAICINMYDSTERGHQVSMMGDIFSQAQQVIVWLGEPGLTFPEGSYLSDLEDDARQDLTAITMQKKPESHAFRLARVKAFAHLFESLWCSRVWALQEYVLAKAVIFQFGSETIGDEVMTHNVEFIMRELSFLIEGGTQQGGIELIRSRLQEFQYFNWVRETWDSDNFDEVNFGQAVATAQELHATDPRDHVFGLLALAPSSLRESFLADYCLTVDEVYHRLATAMSLTTKVEAELDLIRELYLSDSGVCAPDWLPDWIDDLSLRVSDLLQEESSTIQTVVVECLEVLTIHRRPQQETIYLSVSEKSNYFQSLQNTSRILRLLLTQIPSARAPALAASITAPTTLHTLEECFSDSGCSSASSSVEETSLVADKIAAHLLSHKFLHRLMVAANKLDNCYEHLEHKLRPCIRHLGHELDSLASDFEELLAARELEKHAQYIARALVLRIRSLDDEEDQQVRMQRTSKIAKLLNEQSSRRQNHPLNSLRDVKPSSANLISLKDDNRQDESRLRAEVSQQDLPKTALDRVKDFMTLEDVFIPFLHVIQRMVYSSPMESIEAEVRQWILQETSRQAFSGPKMPVSYKFATTLPIEVLQEEKLKHLLTISGTSHLPYATNCESYLRRTWPGTGDYLVRAFAHEEELEVDNGVNLPGQGTKLHVLERTEKGVVISAQMSTYHDVKTVRDIAQQIAWLTAACRRSEPAKVSLSEILCFVTDEGTFQISLLPLKEVVEHREACWTPLFPGSVIAHRWPIPRRSGENGIELPFHLMTTLAGPLYPMKFGPGFCLKAHSRILFPTAIKNCESLHVQWHFESKTAGQLAPPWHHNHGDPWDKINSLDTKDMVGARTFLGYCKKAVVDLGTEKPIEYHRRILYSGLDDEDHAPAIGMPTTISVGTASLLPIKVDAMIPIIRSKAQLLAADLERDYMDVVYEAGERPVILYDSNGSARAWMVPLSCVLLHMVHTWSAKKATLTKNLPAIKLTSNSGTEARKILLEKLNFVVRKTIDTELHKDKLVRDLVIQFWKDICQKQFQDLLATTQADCNYEFQTQKLHG